jgi:hypothetical protein
MAWVGAALGVLIDPRAQFVAGGVGAVALLLLALFTLFLVRLVDRDFPPVANDAAATTSTRKPATTTSV